jgi:hypothetical protein
LHGRLARLYTTRIVAAHDVCVLHCWKRVPAPLVGVCAAEVGAGESFSVRAYVCMYMCVYMSA